MIHQDFLVEVYNPHNSENLPIIFGFNNGGPKGWLHGVLIAEDGTFLGDHICSDESYMPQDLGIVRGSRPDRHEHFKRHYTNGYKMEFVHYTDPRLQKAIELNSEINK